MCVIAIKPKNMPMFADDEIMRMFAHNPHGAGLMFRKGNLTHIEKGFFKVEELLTYLKENANFLKDKDVVLHFRIATSGKKNDLNCHPYPVFRHNDSKSKDDSCGMAHNGVLDGCGWKGNDEINDTQVFIKDLKALPHNFLKNAVITKLIAKSIGTNKLAFLDKDGIHTFGDFKQDGGYLYSNLNHRPTYSYYNYNRANVVIPTETKSIQTPLFNDCGNELELPKRLVFNKKLPQKDFENVRNWVLRYSNCSILAKPNKFNILYNKLGWFEIDGKNSKVTRCLVEEVTESKYNKMLDNINFATNIGHTSVILDEEEFKLFSQVNKRLTPCVAPWLYRTDYAGYWLNEEDNEIYLIDLDEVDILEQDYNENEYLNY